MIVGPACRNARRLRIMQPAVAGFLGLLLVRQQQVQVAALHLIEGYVNVGTRGKAAST